jgi:hypothetical protein
LLKSFGAEAVEAERMLSYNTNADFMFLSYFAYATYCCFILSKSFFLMKAAEVNFSSLLFVASISLSIIVLMSMIFPDKLSISTYLFKRFYSLAKRI